MPNFSGIWTVTQQMQAKGASTWPAFPGAPTIGTATVASATSVSVPFTAPACTGYPAGVTGYRVISTPGCISNTGASSPIVVSGLTTGTAYTFKAQAQNANGYGALSAASNSVTPAIIGQQAFTTVGTFSWVAPSGVTSVSAVAVGGGGGGRRQPSLAGGGGGGLGYKNNITVIPGNSYTVVVGAGGTGGSSGGCNGQASYFINCSTVAGLGGTTPTGSPSVGGTGGSRVGDGGGNGGSTTYQANYGGAGAGGYSGNGSTSGTGVSGSGGAGSGGGQVAICGFFQGMGGGGVGILGQGANGAYPAGGGSGGACGQVPSAVGCTPAGGAYGGGGSWTGTGGSGNPGYDGNGARGAVRIIWPGTFRQFPSTCTGNL